MDRFKYRIFDLDGTLLDSMFVWRDLGSNYLLEKGFNPPDNLREIIASMSMQESAEYFQRAFGIKSSTEEIITDVKKIIADKYKYELELKPYVKEYLQKLKYEGSVMCIATATPLKLAKVALERNEIMEYFSFVSSCDEVGVGKDQPDIFYYAAKKLNAEPAEIVVYDDADFALITAKEAGFYTIGVYDKFSKSNKKDIELISDRYIESFKELL